MEIVKNEDKNIKEIYVIYRENDSYNKHVPKIEGILTNLGKNAGYSLKKKAFPRNTSESEIKEWFEKEKDKITAKGVVCLRDCTCKLATKKIDGVNNNVFHKWSEEYTDEEYTLDTLFGDATHEIVMGGYYSKYYDLEKGSLRPEFKNLKSVLKREEEIYLNVLNRITQKPEILYIASVKLTHHEPFYEMFKSRNKSTLVEEDRKAADILKAWFEKAGIKKVRVVDYPEDLEENIETNSWLITDRHVCMKEGLTSRLSEKSKILLAPSSDFIEYAQDLGLVDVYTDEEYCAILEELIKKVPIGTPKY